MDIEPARKAFGDSGVMGLVLAAFGLLVVARENRRAAVGALAIVVGSALLAYGLVGSFLESMGMEYEDLY